jgi:hypothetical protein
MQCPPTKPGLKGKNSIWFELLLKRLAYQFAFEYFSQLVYESNINITLVLDYFGRFSHFYRWCQMRSAVITD